MLPADWTRRRGRRLHAALAAVRMPPQPAEVRLVPEWLYRWLGIGLVAAGMTPRVGRPAHRYAARDWRSNFFSVGIEQSIVGGTAWERTPWRAAWKMLEK